MKTCCKCTISKDESEFTKSSSSSDGLFSYCKSCRRELDKEYHKNRDIKLKYDQLKARTKANKDYILEFFKKNPCLHCGNDNPIVLDFHHLRDKKYNISDMSKNTSLDKIKLEIAKCIVLCSNCHRIVTYNERKLVGSNPAISTY